MRWHLYCRVVDNLGDIGVAWRLAADLASRGEHVRLALDDATALAWMAPGGADRVEVCAWTDVAPPGPDVVVELFGGGLPDAEAAAASAGHAPVIVNVEHLSAESYVERSHGLPSPRRTAHGLAFTTWYFYPGFVEPTGGLLREPGLLERRREFDAQAWLASKGLEARPEERRVSLFCYANDAVASMLDRLGDTPTLVLAAPGAASEQVREFLGTSLRRAALRALPLPWLSQVDYDRLLWSSHLNFVRGEDSPVRAMWAGVPFVWQLYVQGDGVHLAKLGAFLDRFLAGAPGPLVAPVRSLFARWNGAAASEDFAALGPACLVDWSRHCERWREGLAAQDDLVTRLIRFVRSKR
jgi:uncharacterized repeat protein (TIGR03837 family)